MNELESSVESSSAFLSGGYLNVIATAAVIIVVTFVVSELAVRAMRKAYHVAADTEKAASILILGIRIVVWAIGAYMLCKNCFNIDLSVVVGALGVGGLALSLGLQDTIKNILGGAQITFNKEFGIGDWIKLGGIEGTVKDVNLRYTTIEDDIGQTHLVPNAVINSSTVTRMPEFFRVPLALTLARNIDLEAVEAAVCAIADKALDAKDMRFEDKHSVLVEAGVGASGVEATLVVFATWDFSGAQVKSTVLSPVIAYLQVNNYIGRLE